MNIKDVPNDKESFKGKSDMRKLVYAINDDGTYTNVNSDGWEVENLATRQAWDAVEEELKDIIAQVKAGQLSPIAYYMHKCLMELPVLARYVGKFRWQVKRHFKPSIFAFLSQKTLERYASVFNITVEQLRNPSL
jgi:hypothetical protein